MGRRKTNTAKSQIIRITLRARMDLWEIRREYQMPSRYKEGDTVQAMILLLKNKRNENNN